MSSGTRLEMSAAGNAFVLAKSYEKYLPVHERQNFLNDLRESIRKVARLSGSEVNEELWEQIRKTLEMRDDQLPAKRESLTTGCDPAAPDFLDRCRKLARLVLARDSKLPTPWTHDAAEFVLTALIAFVAVCEPRESRRNLLTVRKLLAAPGLYKAAIEAMQGVGQEGDLIRRLGQQLTWLHECDLCLVMVPLLLRTSWMESAAARLASPDFELRRLRLDRGPALLASACDGRAAWWGRMRSRLAGLTGTRLQPKP